MDNPANWFDETTNGTATHAPTAGDTAIFKSSAQGLYPGGTSDGSGGFIVNDQEFAPATLDIAAGAHVTLIAGSSAPDYTAGTLQIGAGGSLALRGASMDAATTEIAANATLDLSQAYWVGAPQAGPPSSIQQFAVQAANRLNYPGPLNGIGGNLTLAAGGSLVLGNADFGVASFTDANATGTGNAFAPLAGVSGIGTLVAPNGAGPYGSFVTNAINFGTVDVGQTVTETLSIHGGPGLTGSGLPTGAIQTAVNGAQITDSDLSGAGVTAQDFGTQNYSGSGASAVAAFTITLDAQHAGVLQNQSVNVAFTLNDGQYGGSVLVPITGDVVQVDQSAPIGCFAAGTHVLTEHGERLVETLVPGDRLRTAAGRLAPVRWVGRTTLSPAHDAAPMEHAPIRICAGALAPGVPQRDLLVSGDHALLLDGVLLPARLLINGATIRRDPLPPRLIYIHVELDRHDAVLAEGVAAESYLDTGNRLDFEGQGGVRNLRPAAPAERLAATLAAYAAQGCAPLCLSGPILHKMHRRLLRRAASLGWRRVSGAAPVLHADGRVLAPRREVGGVLEITVPAGTRELRLLSRRFVPSEMDASRPDGRTLGMAVAIRLAGAELPDSTFAAGWYPPDAAGCAWRWTDGAARLDLPPSSAPGVLTLQVMAAGARYWIAPAQMCRQAA